ncbi:MAG: hypothetical protein HPY57_15675 [Ignavibacteria bacterium]|nr:hypothetical protein [Ignavibacteria bacterium]
MKYLKKIESYLEPIKSILITGFETLMYNTHLVQDQVRNNLDDFISELDTKKFEAKFGKITKFLGAGVFGAVFQLNNGKILKITFDFHEAPFLYEYCKLKRTPGLVKIDDVFKIKFGDTNAYIITRDPIQVVKNKDYPEEIKRAQDAMYKISPIWRGTHEGNFGIQNGEVVLYDGFCKKAKVDESKIPFLDITKNH